MFKPARMTRVLMGGHKSLLEDVIGLLHAERALHLEDYEDPTATTQIGDPLPAGEHASELLVRTRGLLRALDADSEAAREMATKDPAHVLADAEAAVGPIVEEAAQLRQEIHAMDDEMDLLRPFMGVEVDLALLKSLETVRPYMGMVAADPRPAMDEAGLRYEADLDGQAFIAVVDRGQTTDADRILGDAGYTATALPEDASGTPALRVQMLREERERRAERLHRAEARTAALREQWGPRLAALERHLVQLVDKTQAPLHFAITETTFHIEGWLPRRRADRVREAVSARFGESMYFEELGDGPRGSDDGHEDGHVPDAEHQAPVKLENRGPAKPYEFLLNLLGRPRYHEIDPTKLMLVFFPLFFGLMVGDVLVGLAIMAFGFWLKSNHIFGIGGPAVGRTLLMGGLIAVLAGIFVFGEALGIHFVVSDEALEEGEHSWEEIIYGHDAVLAGEAGFPTEGFIHKEVSHGDEGGGHGGNTTDGQHNITADGGTGDGTIQTLAESTQGAGGGPFDLLKPHGEVHLNAGGIVNLGYYSKIHDIQALLVWSVIIGVLHLVLGFLIGARNVAKSHGLKLAVQEKLSWLGILVAVGLIAFGIGDAATVAAGVGLLVLSIALLWMGVAATIGVGFIALLEVPGLFGNILSYTRLAAIGRARPAWPSPSPRSASTCWGAAPSIPPSGGSSTSSAWSSSRCSRSSRADCSRCGCSSSSSSRNSTRAGDGLMYHLAVARPRPLFPPTQQEKNTWQSKQDSWRSAPDWPSDSQASARASRSTPSVPLRSEPRPRTRRTSGRVSC